MSDSLEYFIIMLTRSIKLVVKCAMIWYAKLYIYIGGGYLLRFVDDYMRIHSTDLDDNHID